MSALKRYNSLNENYLIKSLIKFQNLHLFNSTMNPSGSWIYFGFIYIHAYNVTKSFYLIKENFRKSPRLSYMLLCFSEQINFVLFLCFRGYVWPRRTICFRYHHRKINYFYMTYKYSENVRICGDNWKH